MKIVLTGGGTGGHLFPLIAVADKIREKNPDAQFLFIGPQGKLEKEIMDKENIPIKNIAVGKMRRYLALANFVDFFRTPIGVVQSLWHLLRYMPDAIFSKGGYASFPVVIAGWLYRIPILIHESDSVPGLANDVLGKFAERVAVSYPQAEKEFASAQVVLTGNPLRPNIAQGDAGKVRTALGIGESKKVIFVWGGSQGSQTINDKILTILPELLRDYCVIHQTGENNVEQVKHKAGELGIKANHDGYFVFPFVREELIDILALSDLVITRAGANSLSEVAANKKPAIVIPLEGSANDHQRMNAYALARIGGCVVLEENNLGEHVLMNKISEIMNNPEISQKLAQNIQSFYHVDAAEKIAKGILEMIEN